jgi:uncharacterized protein (DUF58 family)
VRRLTATTYRSFMPTAKSSKKSTYSLQITPAGLIFSIMVMLVAVLALSSGNNLLYVLVAVLMAILALSLFASRAILSRVDLEMRYPERATIGETVAFDLSIRNRRRLFPVLSVTVTLIEQPAWSARLMRFEQGYLSLLPRRTEALVRAERQFARRGIYCLRAFRLETRFPFGFFEHRRMIPAEGALRIHPAISPLTALEAIIPWLQGLEANQRKGSGSDLYAIRDSQGRDPHHHIDWKATARTGNLMVREFTSENQWQVTIILDGGEGDPGEPFDGSAHFDEAGIVFVASLVEYLSGRGARIQVLTPRRTISSGSGPGHKLAIFDLLTDLPVRQDADIRTGWWARILAATKSRGRLRSRNTGKAGIEPRRPDWYLDRVGQPGDGAVILMVPTAERAERVVSDERITVMACHQHRMGAIIR